MNAPRASAPFPLRVCLFGAALLVVNGVGAHVLDALGLVEGLLSPHGAALALLLPLAGLFYAARIVVLFAAPGLVLGALVVWIVDRRASAGKGT